MKFVSEVLMFMLSSLLFSEKIIQISFSDLMIRSGYDNEFLSFMSCSLFPQMHLDADQGRQCQSTHKFHMCLYQREVFLPLSCIIL